MSKMLYSSHLFTFLQRSGRWYFVSFFLYCNVALFFMLCDPLLPNFIPRWGLAIPDFPGLFEKSSFKMADSQRVSEASQSKNSNESILFRRNIDQYSLGESAST